MGLDSIKDKICRSRWVISLTSVNNYLFLNLCLFYKVLFKLSTVFSKKQWEKVLLLPKFPDFSDRFDQIVPEEEDSHQDLLQW